MTRAIVALSILAALLGVAGPAAASLQFAPPAEALAAGPLHSEPLVDALGPEEPEFGLYEFGARDLLALAAEASPNTPNILEVLAGEALIDTNLGAEFEPVRPKNRIGAFDFLGGVCIGAWSTVTPELHWGCGRADVEIVSELFQGAWTDPVTGLAYHRQRWYDPRTASWLSEDAYGDIDSPNLYAYVGWGPQSGTDPMGLCLGFGKPCSAYAAVVRDWFSAGGNSAAARIHSAHRPANLLMEPDWSGDEEADAMAAQAQLQFASTAVGEVPAAVLDLGHFSGDVVQKDDPAFWEYLVAGGGDLSEMFLTAIGLKSLLPTSAKDVVRQAALAEQSPARPLGSLSDGGEFLDDSLRMVEQPLGPTTAPYADRRPNLRRSTNRTLWESAPDGSVPGAKRCSTCEADVFGNPRTGELRNIPDGWDADHIRKWEEIRRELARRGASAAEYRAAYNDLENLRVRCRTCNRADNKVGSP